MREPKNGCLTIEDALNGHLFGRRSWDSFNGGGIRSGQVYGSYNPSGAYPKNNPVRLDDITATVFHALGLYPQTTIYDQLGRPMPISAGKPIQTLFG